MDQQHHLSDLSIDAVASQELRDIAKWGRFLSIVGFVTCGLVVLLGIFSASFLSDFGKLASNTGYASGMGGIIAAFYIVFAIIYFFPVLFLFQSSTKMRTALNENDQQVFNEALIKLKAFFRYVGILTIIILAFYALAIFFVMIAGVMR
jgi:hypothetical protein